MPSPMEIYAQLPQTNCKRCGETSCMAFAFKLQRGEMTPEEANMLLDAFGKDESLDTLEKRGRAQFRGVLKNW